MRKAINVSFGLAVYTGWICLMAHIIVGNI